MNQKGAALAYAMLAVAVASSVVIFVSSIQRNQRIESKIYERQIARDAIARNIAESLTNPLILLTSATQGAGLPGNNILSACLGNPDPTTFKSTTTATLSGNTLSGGGCTIPNRNTGMEFVLIPQPSFWMQNCPAASQAAPANLRPLTCFIAGNRNGQHIAYNFDGVTSPAAADLNFPLEARVYFRPICRISNPAQLNCQFAEAFEFRYEIQQMVTQPNRTTLGTYPTQKQWITMNSSTIVQSQCNTGAIVTANKQSGAFECKCYPPYVPLLSPPVGGNPVYNAQGPVCVNQNSCAAGTVQVGKDANSNPICSATANRIVQTPSISYSTDDVPTDRLCNVNNNGAWVSNITRNCHSKYNPAYQQCPTGCSKDWWPVLWAVLALVIVAMIIAIVLTALSLIPIFGAFFIIPAAAARLRAMLMLAVGGAVLLAYMLNQTDYDWIYVDNNYGHTPHVYCDVTLECSNIGP